MIFSTEILFMSQFLPRLKSGGIPWLEDLEKIMNSDFSEPLNLGISKGVSINHLVEAKKNPKHFWIPCKFLTKLAKKLPKFATKKN